MERLISLKSIAALAVVLGGFAAASAAHARGEVHFSIGVHSPGYVQPAPVYVQPAPVYVAPRHVYVQPDYDGRWEHRRWQRRGPYGDWDGDGIANIYDRHNDWRHGRHWRRHGPWGDFDRDGVPNRYDRFPGNPYHR